MRTSLAAVCIGAASVMGLGGADVRVPTQDAIVYGEAAGETLTMDYYAPKGRGAHPIAIVIHGGGTSAATARA